MIGRLFSSVAALALGLAACTPATTTLDPVTVVTPPPSTCGSLLPLHVVAPGKTVYGYAYERPLVFLGALAVDADGAPRAYHPDNVSGLDALSNAGRPGNWWGIATDARGAPFVQGPADPAPGFYVSTTALVDELVPARSNPARYVDAASVPYIALPGGREAKKVWAGAGAKLGDLAVVYNLRTRTLAAAVWADEGPRDKLGEGSIKLAADLGYTDTSPRTGGTKEAENVFLLFAGSSKGWPLSSEELAKTALGHFANWGGETRLLDCAKVLAGR